jgi:hypothetical protein
LISALCLFLLGLSFLCLGFNILLVKWNNWRVKFKNIIVMVVSAISITLYQILVLLGYENREKFLPYSAVFLNINVMLLSGLIFVVRYMDVKGVRYVLEQLFPPSGKGVDRNRDTDMLQEIQAQQDDPNW